MKKIFIIAEAGVNHNGSLSLAKKLIDVAVRAGADAVKFQTFNTDQLVVKGAVKANYQKKTTEAHESQFDMLKKLQLSEKSHVELVKYCKKSKIMFLSTPFDLQSVDYLHGLGMRIFKIPSGEITNLPYLRRVGHRAREVILSTGMSNLAEIEAAVNVLIESGVQKSRITVLHATSEYPCPIDEVNLNAMQTIRIKFGVNVGYSDHTNGIEVSVAAAALGATVLEKHFTLDKKMVGPDHKASLEPNELIEMVRCVRNISRAMGNGKKKPSASEIKNIKVGRKSIVASRLINAGEVLNSSNITTKRPGTGLSPMKWDDVVGQIARKSFKPDEMIVL